MPYTRRRKFGRKTYRKKRTYRPRKMRLYKRMNNQGLFHVKQRVNGSTMNGLNSRTIAQALIAQHLGVEFRLRDVPQYLQFAAVWDQYRINKIVLHFIPMATVNATGTTNTFNNGVLATVIDYDNGAQPLATLNEYEQYTNCKIVPCIRTQKHTRIFVPRINTGVQNQGGAVVSGGNKGKQWIDCQLPDVAHNGLKIYIDPYPTGTPGGAQTWQVFGTYYLSFRNVH